MKVASVFWGDSWSYDQKAKNFSAEALRYEAMLKPPKTAPKPKIKSPGTTSNVTAPTVTTEKKEISPAVAEMPTGTYADREGLELQIKNLQSEMQAYYDASEGKADPQVMVWYANRIHDTMTARDALPAEETENTATAPAAVEPAAEPIQAGEKLPDWKEYLRKSARQVVMGNYTDDVTLAGTAGQVALGLLGADLPADLRDLYYDLTHLKTTPWHQTALDAVALLPVVGGLKYADEAATLLKQGQNAAESLADAAKHGDDLVDAGGELVYNGAKKFSEIELTVGEQFVQKISNLPANPRVLLEQGWTDVTPSKMAENTSYKLFQDSETGLTIRFDEGREGAFGFAAQDHYHIYNPNATGKGDYYLDINGNPVAKNSRASHIIPTEVNK